MFNYKILSKIFLLCSLVCISFTFCAKCKDGSNCPGSQTCCLAARGLACCPYEEAICCGDGQHCCPNGYVCGDTACFAPSQGMPALSLLLNSNRKSFLETSSASIEKKILLRIESENQKSEKDVVEDEEQRKLISSCRSGLDKTELDFNANSGSQKSLEILEDETKKSTIVSRGNSASNRESFLNKSRFQVILDKLENLNSSYMKSFFGCFKDMEPVVQDLINAYRQKKEKTETLIRIVEDLVKKLSVDGANITTDCKAILALAGFAGII